MCNVRKKTVIIHILFYWSLYSQQTTDIHVNKLRNVQNRDHKELEIPPLTDQQT